MPARQSASLEQSRQVRRAGPPDLASIVAVLSAAFANDPVFTWWVPDAARRRVLIPALFRIAVDENLPYGEVYVAGSEPAAAAVWVAPGLEPDADAAAALVARYMAAAEETYQRLLTVIESTAEVHPQEPHAYLFLLATRPERQSEGLGSALLRHVLDRCDREQTPAYLEATSDDNVRLYQRHGFKVTGKICLPDGPPLWPMWRSPTTCPESPQPG